MIKHLRWCLPAASLLLGGCEFIDPDTIRVRGSGRVITDERPVDGVTEVTLASIGDLKIEQGSPESLKIEAEDNILPKIRIEMHGGNVVIGSERGVSLSPTVPIRYTLVVRELRGIELSGSGTITASSLRSDELAVRLPGSGDIHVEEFNGSRLNSNISGSGEIEIRGAVETQDVGISGSGDYTAGDLQSRSATVHISGSGEAKLWVRDMLSANISGSGDVEYYGSPKVSKSVSGSGGVEGLGPR
jgi:hypothetical protein